MSENKSNRKPLSELSSDNKEKSLEKVHKKANITRIVMIVISAIIVAVTVTILVVNHFKK